MATTVVSATDLLDAVSEATNTFGDGHVNFPEGMPELIRLVGARTCGDRHSCAFEYEASNGGSMEFEDDEAKRVWYLVEHLSDIGKTWGEVEAQVAGEVLDFA